MREDSCPRPISPYGVTKLAGEHLCRLYHTSFGLATLILRYFTVYGPRQRPDMAIHRFIKAIRDGKAIPVYGDGGQSRDFTYVHDVVAATVLAMQSDTAGTVFNVGGGSRVTINQTIGLLARIMGQEALVEYQRAELGDVRDTLSDTSRAQRVLCFAPQVSFEDGVKAEVAWALAQS